MRRTQTIDPSTPLAYAHIQHRAKQSVRFGNEPDVHDSPVNSGRRRRPAFRALDERQVPATLLDNEPHMAADRPSPLIPAGKTPHAAIGSGSRRTRALPRGPRHPAGTRTASTAGRPPGSRWSKGMRALSAWPTEGKAEAAGFSPCHRWTRRRGGGLPPGSAVTHTYRARALSQPTASPATKSCCASAERCVLAPLGTRCRPAQERASEIFLSEIHRFPPASP